MCVNCNGNSPSVDVVQATSDAHGDRRRRRVRHLLVAAASHLPRTVQPACVYLD